MAHCSISISCIGQSGQKEWLKTFKTHLKRAISVTAHKTCRSTPNRQTHVNWCRELELERVWWVWCLQTEPTCEHLFPKSSLDVELISAFWARKQFTSKKTSRLDVTSRETCDFLVKQKECCHLTERFISVWIQFCNIVRHWEWQSLPAGSEKINYIKYSSIADLKKEHTLWFTEKYLRPQTQNHIRS